MHSSVIVEEKHHGATGGPSAEVAGCSSALLALCHTLHGKGPTTPGHFLRFGILPVQGHHDLEGWGLGVRLTEGAQSPGELGSPSTGGYNHRDYWCLGAERGYPLHGRQSRARGQRGQGIVW